MKTNKAIIIVMAWLFLSGTTWIDRIQNFEELHDNYREAQKRIEQLEERNERLEARLQEQGKEAVVDIEIDRNDQVETLQNLLTSEN